MKIVTLLVITLLISAELIAKEHTVKLLTKSSTTGETMLMEPGFIKIEKGDSIRFVPSDVSHNAQSLSIPLQASAFNTAMGEETVITFDQEGVYLYKCTPHFALGMIGVIQVSQPINRDSVQKDWLKVKPRVVLNKEKIDLLLSQITE